MKLICPTIITGLVVAIAAVAAEPTTVRGRVDQVDLANNRLVLTTFDGNRLTLQTTGDTTVEVDGHAAKLSDLSAGQRVHVTYRASGETNQAVTVTARKTTAGDVAREAREALQAAGRYTYQQKDEYEKKLRGVVADLDDRIDDLQRQAQSATEDARRRLEPQIQQLKQKRAVVEERLDKVRAAGADAWNDVKAGVQNAVDDLRRSLDRDRSKPD